MPPIEADVGSSYRGRHRPPTEQRRPIAVRARAVTYEVGGRRILDEVGLDLEPGSFTALTGASGSGKTTLMWVLAGALAPTSGVAEHDGKALVGNDIGATIESPGQALAAVQLVPQGVALVAPLTARENVVVPVLVQGWAAREARARADAALGAVGLDETADHLVEELSGGQQQRVSVARALALRPSVLLADEPTSELDATNRDVVVALLAAEADAGAVVLVATHDGWCAEQADAEYHLSEGRLHRVR